MRVVLLSEVFSLKMGYLENALPKYLARLGADVHVVTMGLPPYYIQNPQEIYRGFADDTGLRPGMVEAHEHYTLHTIAHRRRMGYLQAVGLIEKLRALRPDIVQTTAAIGWLPLQAAWGTIALGYKLFTGNHYHASVFPLAGRKLRPWDRDLLNCRIKRSLPGSLVALRTEKCYAIAPDCADIAARFFGVPRRKIDICSLGVDSDLFSPAVEEADIKARHELRARLGVAEGEIVCAYSGRFTEDKNPLVLAAAVEDLRRRGEPFRGLFVGNGPQRHAIQACEGCITHPFVPVHELGAFFRASDIGIWPTQESTSMLDAAACGLPIVANHTMSASERLDGNGLTYKLNDRDDLARVLLSLKEQERRQRLGSCGADKMARNFSWHTIAARRVCDYERALGRTRDFSKTLPSDGLVRLDD